jgi:hypothetical protein
MERGGAFLKRLDHVFVEQCVPKHGEYFSNFFWILGATKVVLRNLE